LHFALELLQRLRAADGHFFLIRLETFHDAAAARFDTGAQLLNVALEIGAKVLHFGLGLGGNRVQA
jgi:hypothetical protein